MAISRLESLRNRRIDPMVKSARLLNENYERLHDDESIKYAIGAMQPIDPEYTAVSFAESMRVQKHIAPACDTIGVRVEFRNQGSVTNDTHIKAHSDVDTLVIHCGFFDLQPPQKASIRYPGNPLEDLKLLRRTSAQAVKSGFPEVDIDISGARSVSLTGGSLRRDIDLVFANWYNTLNYAKTGDKLWRGVNVLDNNLETRVMNLPFLHNALIKEKNSRVDGAASKMIRLLKSLIYEANEQNGLSSYDITSLIWNMPDRLLAYGHGQELQLMQSTLAYLCHVDQEDAYRNGLKVPNETRLLFGTEGASSAELKVVIKYLAVLLDEIKNGLQRSFRKLAEARIEY